jgi:hypothetical protein
MSRSGLRTRIRMAKEVRYEARMLQHQAVGASNNSRQGRMPRKGETPSLLVRLVDIVSEHHPVKSWRCVCDL